MKPLTEVARVVGLSPNNTLIYIGFLMTHFVKSKKDRLVEPVWFVTAEEFKNLVMEHKVRYLEYDSFGMSVTVSYTKEELSYLKRHHSYIANSIDAYFNNDLTFWATDIKECNTQLSNLHLALCPVSFTYIATLGQMGMMVYGNDRLTESDCDWIKSASAPYKGHFKSAYKNLGVVIWQFDRTKLDPHMLTRPMHGVSYGVCWAFLEQSDNLVSRRIWGKSGGLTELQKIKIIWDKGHTFGCNY